MPPDRAERVAEIVEAALDEDTRDYPAFVAKACGEDAVLRAEVESLLRFRREATGFIEQPAFQANADLLIDSDGMLGPGARVGTYQIISLIGEGGMGEVYLADDLSLGRKVALKFVKSSFGARDLIRQFRREERILAGLTHPNIARLYGGSVAENGAPFFVMEYVEGERLDEYCRRTAASIRERLELFRQICAAVGYAHQHLVIHRDIKPANIRVTAEGEPKLLDFGIAKLLGEESAGALEQTITMPGAMTPDYASPEQVRGEAITTATDIYSLGVVLYELLTGRKPYRLTSHSADEVSRAITTQSPVRPSQAVVERAKQLPAVSPSEIANPRLLRGDLDNIALMALRKEPERRYSSVALFAEDIRRHLEARPVNARRDTWRYRTSKFIARNRIAAAAGVVVALSLIGGILATSYQARRATTERDRAQRRFDDVRQLSNELLFEIAPLIERIEGSTAARQALVTRSLRYLDSLAKESADDPKLQSELAAAYEKIGELQGSPRKPNLNDFEGAMTSYQKARDIRHRLFEQSKDREQLKHYAHDLSALGALQWFRANMNGAFQSSELALEAYARLLRDDPQSLELRRAGAEAQIDVARAHYYNDQLTKVFPLVEQSLATLEDLRLEEPDDTEIRRLLARGRTLLGLTLSWSNRQAEGEAEVTSGVAVAEELAAEHPRDNVLQQALLEVYLQAAQLYSEVDDARAFGILARARQLAEAAVKRDPADIQARQNYAKTYSMLGLIALRLENTGDAIDFLGRSAAAFGDLSKSDGARHTYKHDQGRVLLFLGTARHKRGELAEARAAYEEAEARFTELARVDAGNNFHVRKLATAYCYLAELERTHAERATGAEQTAHQHASITYYRRALEIFEQLEARQALEGYDRKELDKVRAALAAQ